MATPDRSCPQCSKTLTSSEESCSNCGFRYSADATIDATQQAFSNETMIPPSLPQNEAKPLAEALSLKTTASSPHSAEEQNFAPLAPPSSSLTLPSPSSQAYTTSPSANTVGDSAGAYQQQSSKLLLAGLPGRKKGPKILLIVGALILLFALVVGSGIYFYSKSKNRTTTGSTHSITTPTSQPLFFDNFVDNSKGWSTGKGAGYSSTIANNGMLLSEANHKILDEAIPGSNFTPITFSDFMVTTTFTILKSDQNDSVGLYLRGDNNLSQGYFVDIFGDNTYDIFKIFPDSSKGTFLVSPTNSTAINPVGQQNKLTVVMKGSNIIVFINNKVVISITDRGYTSGEISLFVENGKSSSGVSAIFRNVAVYPAPDHLPS